MSTEENIAPLTPSLSKAVSDSVTEALGDFVEKLRSNEHLMKSETAPQAKAWFLDPYQFLDSVGMGYRSSPSHLTFETLRGVSERNSILAAIMLTRINQVASFCRPQENKYSIGFTLRPRGPDKKRRLTTSEKERVEMIQMFLLNTGRDYNLGRDSFEQFMRKYTRDSLTYDQGCFEKVRTRAGGIYNFGAVPSDTIRIAQPRNIKGAPPTVQQARQDVKYVQMMNGQIAVEFTLEELAFTVRNPRTGLKVYGYGFAEIEQLITTVTSHLWAEEWNRRAFSQGSTVKGIFNMKGNMPPAQFEAFKRQWTAQVSGVTNAWRTPVTNVDDIQWMPMQMSNTEMGYQMWMEYLIKVTSAIFQIDPAEVNFDLRGSGSQQPMFMSNNEAQQKVSKDRGLHPLLRFMEDNINKHIVWSIDPRFEFAFVGLDAKTEEQATQLRLQQVQNIYTLNEVRGMEDLPPLKNGDVPLNPTFTGYLMQKANMEQQQAMMGAGGQSGPPNSSGSESSGEGSDTEVFDASQPYQRRFTRKQPGEEEREGADNLNAMFQRSRTESELEKALRKRRPRFKFFDNTEM